MEPGGIEGKNPKLKVALIYYTCGIRKNPLERPSSHDSLDFRFPSCKYMTPFQLPRTPKPEYRTNQVFMQQ